MTTQFSVLLTVGLAGFACVQACGDLMVLEQNFDKYTGAYQLWDKGMGTTDMPGFKFMKLETAGNSMVGDGNYRVTNPQGCVGTAECAATYDVVLPPMDEATLSYKFMHSPGYVFGLGGKLPGLCAMDCPSGCETVTDQSGFSARVMWREDEMDPTQTQMMSYNYFLGMTETHCGENWLWGKTVQAGVWNTIEMYIKVNTNGQPNGVQTITYNGEQVLHKTDVLWTAGYHPIEKFTFRAFHGGSGDKWASAQMQYIYFDDIKVMGGKCTDTGASVAPISFPTPSEFVAPVAAQPVSTVTETTEVLPAVPPVEPEPTEVISTDDTTSDGMDFGSFSSLLPQKESPFVEEEDPPAPPPPAPKPAGKRRVRASRRARGG